jgi:hypothetical protein
MNYGKYLNNEMFISCFHTGRYLEGVELMNELLSDDEFKSDRDKYKHQKNILLHLIHTQITNSSF